MDLVLSISQKERIMDVSTTTIDQYLTFKLDQEVFAIDIAKVREVLDFTTVTKVPRTPDYMRGVINLRGSVVPVIDLRLKFEMSKTEQTVNTCIIISEVILSGDSIIVGMLADSVQEVIDLGPDDFRPNPKVGSQVNNDFIKGMGKRGDGFILLLDIDKVFCLDELIVIKTNQQNIAEASG